MFVSVYCCKPILSIPIEFDRFTEILSSSLFLLMIAISMPLASMVFFIILPPSES